MKFNRNSLTGLALQKFNKNFWGVFSLCFITVLAIISVFAYVITPDATKNANQMHLSINSQSPGFEVTMLTIPSDIHSDQGFLNRILFGVENLDTEIPIATYKIEGNQLFYSEYKTDNSEAEIKQIDLSVFPGGDCSKYLEKRVFYFGTDKYGRDYLSRVIIGSRISFFIGFVAVFISLVVGLIMGSLAGYYGGRIDAFIMWIINVTWSIPTLLLVIAITLALGKGFWQVFIAVGLTMWVEVARVVRGQIISVKEMQYVIAARALGFSDYRIIAKHIFPNIFGPLIVICAANFAAAILIESGLSFLGIGAQPPMASWGAMIKDHYNYIILGQPYLALIPGISIMFLVMAFMLVGNALRDALDVKS